MEDEDEDSNIVITADGEADVAIKDANSKVDITAAVEAAIANAKTSRRRLESGELWATCLVAAC